MKQSRANIASKSNIAAHSTSKGTYTQANTSNKQVNGVYH